MLRLIDPLVDCVFKAILGVQARDWVLIDFLNAILKLPAPIRSVQIQNPYSELDFEEDKLTIVDVHAVDSLGRNIQVELQLQMHAALAERMLYTWANLHKSQLSSGKDFHALRPTYAIWLMRDRLTTLNSAAAHHCFTAHDARNNVALTDQMQIHLIELVKWKPPANLDEESAWLYFFKEAKGWRELPATLQRRPLEAAMTVLRQFSENESDWHRYENRRLTLLLQATLEEEARRNAEQAEQRAREAKQAQERAEQLAKDAEQAKEQAEQAKEQAEQAKEQAEQAKEQAEQRADEAERRASIAERERAETEQRAEAERTRVEQLLARLRAAGLDV